MLLDRSVDYRFAKELRRVPGLYAKSLSEMYGDDVAQSLADVVFLEEAGRHGWMVWTQNPTMWRVDAERQAIERHGTHVFNLGSANLTNPGKGFVFGRHFLSIKRRVGKPGPSFWRLYPDRPPLKDCK